MIPAGMVALPFDAADLQLVSYGLRRANTPRLRELLARTRRHAEIVLRRRMRAGLELEHLRFGWTWRRRARTWSVHERFDVEADGPPSREHLRRTCHGPRKLGCSTVDFATLIGGPLELLVGNTVSFSAVDFDRGTFAHDHVGLVREDGSIGELVVALPAYVPKEKRS